MTFREIAIGERFLSRKVQREECVEEDWYFWRKLDDTHACYSTPHGQDYGPPVTFYATELVRPGA